MSEPLMSVAVLVGALRGRAQRVLEALAEQDVASELEVLVVDLEPDHPPLRIPEPLAGRQLPLPGAMISLGKGEAVRSARAPVIAFLEDHCYPRPGWARALIDTHRGPWAAVGYAFENANPEHWLSRASMLADYGVFIDPPRGPSGFVSGNNVSYKRDALLALGDRLDGLLIVDYNAQSALRARGERLFVEPGALTAHENYARLGDFANANLSYCRAMAANRASDWNLWRRLFYAAVAPVAAPAIKLVRLARALTRRPHVALRTILALPVILIGYAWAAAGESRGYLDSSAEPAEADFLVWELATQRAGA